MADEAILPTTYVYSPHILGQMAPGQFPIGFPHNSAPVSLSGLPIQINAFTNQAAAPPTIFLAGSKLHQNQGQEEAGAGIPSPVNNSGDWRPTTAQKRQRTESASDPIHQPTTPTTLTPTTKQVYDWNNAAPHTPTQTTTPLTPQSAQPMVIPTTLLSPIQQHTMPPISQISVPRTGSTPATPTGNPPVAIPGEVIWPGMGRPIMMAENHGSQQSLDFSDGGSDDSSDTPQSKLGTVDWPQNPNGTLNTSLPQTPTSTTEGSDPNTPGANDAEGVWSPDIEHAFQEALAIYPPCGRRKIILSDEGKMYGRNELIARYIKLRTGKSRSRKQVSSHIQVLAKKKAREIQGKIKDPIAKDKAMANLSSMSSAQIVSASSIHSRPNLNIFPTPGIAPNPMPMGQMFTSSPVNPITIKQEPTASLMWHPSGHTTLVQQPHGLPTHFQNIPGGMIPITFHHPSTIGQATIPTVSTALESTKTTITSPVLTNQSQSPVTVPNHTQEINPIATTQPAPPELPLKLVDFCAFVESQTNQQDTPQKHVFARISDANFNDPDLETIDISHIWDKFPQKSGGLKDMYEKGPQHAFFLVKFWGSVTTPLIEEPDCFYGVSSRFEGSENKTITCSTKVCSFGTQVVEKVETEYAKFENARFVYRINRSPMCEYMLNFIQRLYHLPESYMMNNVLEQFTILQVVSDRDTQETLLCLAYLFEVNSDENGNKFSLYRLVKSN